MDEVFSAEVWSQGTGIVSLVDPRSSLLAVWDQTPGTGSDNATALAKGCSDTAQICSWSFFPSFPQPLGGAGSEAGAMAAQCRWQEWSTASPSASGCSDQAFAGPSSPDWEQTLHSRAQCCLMIHSSSLLIPLGTQKGAGEQISTLQTVSPCISFPFPASLCPYLRAVWKTCQNKHQ